MMAASLRRLAVAAAATLTFCTVADGAFVDLTPLSDATNSVASVPLSSLIDGGAVEGVIVGDLTISGLTYRRTNDMPVVGEVNVFGFRDADGAMGVSLQGNFTDLSGGAASDAAVRYHVQPLATSSSLGKRLSGAKLYLGGATLGDESFFTVDASVIQNMSILNAYSSTVGAGTTSQLSDFAAFDSPLGGLDVTFDVFAFASSADPLPARATSIEQSFVLTPSFAATGDFNADGETNGVDLERWKTSFGVDALADADGDLDSDGVDFLIWQRYAAAQPDAAAIPEPSTAVLFIGFVAFGAIYRR